MHIGGSTDSQRRNTGFYEWGLDLPSFAVSRRIIRNLDINGRVVLGELKGPGCVRKFQVTGRNIGRELVLRIFFDEQEAPAVEAPLADFFGIMHNLSEMSSSKYRQGHRDRASYRLNTPFLISNPHNAFTAYFPMPFADYARFEVINDSGAASHLFYYIDWHEYSGQKLEEPYRFCARWRREAPVRDYQDDFLMLDTDGPGRLIGYVHSIDMLFSRHGMRWSHAGSDNIYIDGVGTHPTHLRGHGAEDTFGASWGGHTYSPQSSLFADMPYYVQKNEDDQDCLKHTEQQKLVGYRFFANDVISFRDSLHMRFGARAHDVAAMVYWYSASPPRPYAQLPSYAERLPNASPGRRFDLDLPDSGEWWICGPFPLPFSDSLPTDSVNPRETMNGRIWRHYAAKQGFVDFNHCFRPAPSNGNTTTLTAAAVASSEIFVPTASKAHITLGWDDELVFRLNDEEEQYLGRHEYFSSREMEIELKQGTNHLAIMLTNTTGLSRGAWCFSCRIVTEGGERLIPRIHYGPVPKEDAVLKVDFGAGESTAQHGFLGFVPPYALDEEATNLGKAVDIICSPQSQVYSSHLGRLTVTAAASHNTSIGFREHDQAPGRANTEFCELLRSDVRANSNGDGGLVELTLTIAGLPVGSYRLETVHHMHSPEGVPMELAVRDSYQPSTPRRAVQTAGDNCGDIARMEHIVDISDQSPFWISFSSADGPVVLNGFVLRLS